MSMRLESGMLWLASEWTCGVRVLEEDSNPSNFRVHFSSNLEDVGEEAAASYALHSETQQL
eukprot:6050232-Amphidinium_carterae.1